MSDPLDMQIEAFGDGVRVVAVAGARIVVALVDRARTPAVEKKETNLTIGEVAKVIDCSTATVRRTIPPTRYIGSAPRWDLVDALAKLDARGRAPSTPPKRERRDQDVDVTEIARRAGLEVRR